MSQHGKLEWPRVTASAFNSASKREDFMTQLIHTVYIASWTGRKEQARELAQCGIRTAVRTDPYGLGVGVPPPLRITT